ncbi:MAG: type I restriction endonuclease subunit R [Candidatus Aminicenantes bacterium]|nr:type I restriction endonuclease subunit R [Candidatus Aminicenantes bacterium]
MTNNRDNFQNPFSKDNTTDTSEKGFQNLIVKELVENQKYRESLSKDFNKKLCLNEKELFEFIKTTQEDAYNFLQKKDPRAFLVRLNKKIKEKGIVEVLRKGVKHLDRTIYLFYSQPVSTLNEKDLLRYRNNIFSVTRELKYSEDKNNLNRIDLVILLNGLPITTMELKNGVTRQAVKNAVRQYQNTRSPKDKIFNFARCLVHFAADTDEVFMTTKLQGRDTQFLPFNKGLNDGEPIQPFGAGNPLIRGEIKTAYLWQEVLTKESLANIIEKFVQKVEEKDEDTKKTTKKLIFPRYHQLTAVRQLLDYTKDKGVGQRYLIQHSTGSGKSYSITWLAHQLVGLHHKKKNTPIFDCVVVVTDRRVLDRQIREKIKEFAHVANVVEAIDGSPRAIKKFNPKETSFSKTTHMIYALKNNKKIIICTVQTFPFVLDVIQDRQKKKAAFILDEAHSSQSGDAAAKMNATFAGKDDYNLEPDEEGNIDTEALINYIIDNKKMLKNASYFAFTATPKNKTLETFGYQDDDDRFYPFHLYSMKQAIEEEFILDVVKHYTTYNSFYKLVKSVEKNPDFEVSEANKKLKSYVEAHEIAIAEKARIMIDHFHKDVAHLINKKAKAMVVTKSIEAAIKYKEAFDNYLEKIHSPFKAIVAFSGTKKHPKTKIELNENKMNNFPDGDNDIVKQFKKDRCRFLIVANKYQTGFDMPLLHTMYVDKKLAGLQAVQTLSRLNRAYKPYKKDTFVLDFYNAACDIRDAFEPYYTATILSEETDVNRLNDLQDDLESAQVYSPQEVKLFNEIYFKKGGRERLEALIDASKEVFDTQLNRNQRISFKASAKSFIRTYNYLVKILDFKNVNWEMLWLFLKHLEPKLRLNDETDFENILEAVDMESYRLTIGERRRIYLTDDEGVIDPLPVADGAGEAARNYDTLDNIINEFNRRFENYAGSEEEISILVQIPQQMKENKEIMNTILNSDSQNARIESDDKLTEKIHDNMYSNTEIYRRYVDDDSFRKRYQEFVFDILYHQHKRQGDRAAAPFSSE